MASARNFRGADPQATGKVLYIKLSELRAFWDQLNVIIIVVDKSSSSLHCRFKEGVGSVAVPLWRSPEIRHGYG